MFGVAVAAIWKAADGHMHWQSHGLEEEDAEVWTAEPAATLVGLAISMITLKFPAAAATAAEGVDVLCAATPASTDAILGRDCLCCE